MASERLFPEERLDQILELLHDQDRVSVADLSERFGVSTVTIRNDLTTLERQGQLIRTYGGAMLNPDRGTELPAFAQRKELHAAEKDRIGRAAAQLVGNGDAIALDPSTTAWYVARQLKNHHELTIVTNGLSIALEFLESPGVSVVMPGGAFRVASVSLVGDQGADILEHYYVQRGFFGAAGFTLAEGLTDTNQYEAQLKRRMMERSKEVIAIVDSSKWGQVTFAPLVSIDRVDRMITDDAAPPEMVAALRERGVDVVLA